MGDRQRLEQSLCLGRQLDQHLAAIGWRGAAEEESPCGKAVDQPDGAVGSDRQRLRKYAGGERLRQKCALERY